MSRHRTRVATFLALLAVGVAAGPAAEPPAARIDVDPLEATVGGRLAVTITVELPPEMRLEPDVIGPQLGGLSVIVGAWRPPAPGDGARVRVWEGQATAFRPGPLTLPPVRIRVRGEDGTSSVLETPEREITILSVLDEEPDAEVADIPPPADIKGPVGLAPDYASIGVAAAVLAVVLLASIALWWLQRRYASRLAAVPPPDDPFARTPAHVWVYAELQQLLERRLADSGEIVEFFNALSRIMKLYLGGRYRVELMERTSDEMPQPLRQAGAPETWIQASRELLRQCDMVKFAKAVPEAQACRSAIEEAYRIVDGTRPDEAQRPPDQRGVA